MTSLAAAELLYELMFVMALHPLDKVAIQPYERPERPYVPTPPVGAPSSPMQTFEWGATSILAHVLVPCMKIVGALALLAALTVVVKESTKRVLT